MPNYNWVCKVCDSEVDAEFNVCSACNSPASMSLNEIQQRKAAFFNSSPLPKTEKRYIFYKVVFILFALLSVIGLITGRSPVWGQPIQISLLISMFGYAFQVAIIHKWFAITQFIIHSFIFSLLFFGCIVKPLLAVDIEMLTILSSIFIVSFILFWLPSYKYTFKSNEIWAKNT